MKKRYQTNPSDSVTVTTRPHRDRLSTPGLSSELSARLGPEQEKVARKGARKGVRKSFERLFGACVRQTNLPDTFST